MSKSSNIASILDKDSASRATLLESLFRSAHSLPPVSNGKTVAEFPNPVIHPICWRRLPARQSLVESRDQSHSWDSIIVAVLPILDQMAAISLALFCPATMMQKTEAWEGGSADKVGDTYPASSSFLISPRLEPIIQIDVTQTYGRQSDGFIPETHRPLHQPTTPEGPLPLASFPSPLNPPPQTAIHKEEKERMIPTNAIRPPCHFALVTLLLPLLTNPLVRIHDAAINARDMMLISS